jgi:hypothetical protein
MSLCPPKGWSLAIDVGEGKEVEKVVPVLIGVHDQWALLINGFREIKSPSLEK